MFENLAAAERNRGLRGFKRRHFSQFVDEGQVKPAIGQLTLVFLALTACAFVKSFLDLLIFLEVTPEVRDMAGGAAMSFLMFEVVFLVSLFLVLWIRFRKNRVAAILYALLWSLVTVTIVTVRPTLVAGAVVILGLAMSLRLVQACFAYQRFRRSAPIEIFE